MNTIPNTNIKYHTKYRYINGLLNGVELQKYKNNAVIYCFYNNKTTMLYIGSTYNIKTRIGDHIKNTQNIYLSKAFKNRDDFSLYIIDIFSKSIENQDLRKAEFEYIKSLPENRLYNIILELGPFLLAKKSIKYCEYLKKMYKGMGNPMSGKPKSKEFLEWQGKPRFGFGPENYMFERGLALSVWTTHGCFVGDFKTRKQIAKTLKISKDTINKYYKKKIPYFSKNNLFGFIFYDIPEIEDIY